jgi:hypothetical protein
VLLHERGIKKVEKARAGNVLQAKVHPPPSGGQRWRNISGQKRFILTHVPQGFYDEGITEEGGGPV